MSEKVFKAKRCNNIGFMSVEDVILSGAIGEQQAGVSPAFVFPPVSEIVTVLIFVAITLFVAFIVIKIIQKTLKKSLERKHINQDIK